MVDDRLLLIHAREMQPCTKVEKELPLYSNCATMWGGNGVIILGWLLGGWDDVSLFLRSLDL